MVLEVDWVSEEENDPDQFGATTAARLDLTVEVVEAVGPGGGWPLLRFYGDPENVARLAAEYAGMEVIR